MGVVPESVEQSDGQLLVSEDLDPFPEGEVRGYEGGADLMPLGNEVEQKLPSCPLERDKPQSSSRISRSNLLSRRWSSVSVRSSRASVRVRTRSAARWKATLKRRLAASTPSEIATWVLPVPTGPAIMQSRAWVRNSQEASSMTFCLETPFKASQSSWSRVFVSGKRASLRRLFAVRSSRERSSASRSSPRKSS